jgi:putative transposase
MSHTERAKYLTDLADEHWHILRKVLPEPSRRGAPRTICRRAVLNAIIYSVRSGRAWRRMPREFPNWKAIYGICIRRRSNGARQRVHDAHREMLRRGLRRKKSLIAAIIDSQIVKTWEVKGQRGNDVGKKISGCNPHVAVDTLGLILAIVVHPEDVEHQDGAALVLGTLGRLKERPHRRGVIFAESACGQNNLPGCVKAAFGWLMQTVLRPAKVGGFVVLPKHWILERTFGWLDRYRKHSEDCERSAASSEAMIYVAMTHIMLWRPSHHALAPSN